jgi:hypothetical protein
MVGDLRHRYLHTGMTRREVVVLLGAPDFESRVVENGKGDITASWLTSASADCITLALTFGGGRVLEIYEGQTYTRSAFARGASRDTGPAHCERLR